MMKLLSEIFEWFSVKFSRPTRIIMAVFLVVVVLAIILTSTLRKCSSNQEQIEADTNVYLNEEVCYAGNIYLSVVGLNVIKNSDEVNYDEDGDKLSEYTLNLKLSVEYRSEKEVSKNEKSAMIRSDYFSLKETNIENKGAMGLFFENLAKATLSAMLDVAVGGDINVLESTASFALDYASSVVDEVSTKKSKLKPIKASKNQFEPFRPSENEGKTFIDLSFQLKENYLESNRTIVLAVDTWNHWEKHIFLITRPTT